MARTGPLATPCLSLPFSRTGTRQFSQQWLQGHWAAPLQGGCWGLDQMASVLDSYSGNAECWCPHLLTLFTKLSHYLSCVRISLGCGRIGQMGWKTFLRAWHTQDWTDGLREVTFGPGTHGRGWGIVPSPFYRWVSKPLEEFASRLERWYPSITFAAEFGKRIFLRRTSYSCRCLFAPYCHPRSTGICSQRVYTAVKSSLLLTAFRQRGTFISFKSISDHL